MAFRSTVPDNPFFPRPPMPDTLLQRRMLPTLLLYFYHLAGFALVIGGVVLTSKR